MMMIKMSKYAHSNQLNYSSLQVLNLTLLCAMKCATTPSILSATLTSSPSGLRTRMMSSTVTTPFCGSLPIPPADLDAAAEADWEVGDAGTDGRWW